MHTQTAPLTRERTVILVLLLALSVLAWGISIWQARSMAMPMVGSMGLDLTMGMNAVLFLAVWIAMMVAMMFPSAAPMVLTFAAVYRGRAQRGQAFVPTWIFVAGYLLVWVLFGVVAYLLALLVNELAARVPSVAAHANIIAGVLIVIAGCYQLSPFKSACLKTCRTPTQFVLTAWRNGSGGALRMGLEHGVVCLGCCWLLFLVLFPLGIMNLAVMALLTAIIFAEKVLPAGRAISTLIAIALVAYGLLVCFVPGALPGLMPTVPTMLATPMLS